MSGLAHHAKIAARIVFEHDGQMHVVFEVLFDRFDDRDLALERHVHDVGALLWPDAHAIARFYWNAEDGDALDRFTRWFECPVWIPVSHARPPASWRLRMMPCVR